MPQQVVLRSPARMTAGFVLMAAPPGMPNAKQPVVLAQASYLGPQADADEAFAHWNDTAIAERAITVKPGSFELTGMNMQRDAMMTKGSNIQYGLLQLSRERAYQRNILTCRE
ncbi:hypothetical protein F4680DRAFT_217629 [Xylaria scruposa]|nr:hypothetical protein F4680DRAFT_217629 [Xylaria scruposa]